MRLGRGAATTYPGNLVHSDCIVIEGSNMAECHPVAFRYVMQAKLNGAKIIHADPRFTRTTAMADIHAPVRAGSDIAFLGGLVNYVINSERWNTDPFFKEYVVTFTNAATIINPDFKDTSELDGVFSGLGEYKEGAWGLNGFIGQYANETWQYAAAPTGDQGRTAATAQSGEQGVESGQPGAEGTQPPPPGSATQPAQSGPATASTTPAGLFDALVQSLPKPAPHTDPTLQDPMCVFQILKRHFAAYTPEMVQQVTGCPQDRFVQVAETLLANSGADRTSAFCYAVGWTQHTYGVQQIGCCALLQLLLGNIGRPGGGVMALRGHATIQGSTDVPTLYHSIHGYMPAPSILREHNSLEEYLTSETLPRSFWANTPKFMVSYLKSMWGEAATAENEFGYAWHPRITGDHSHMPMMQAMMDGRVEGMFAMGQNPAVGGQNAIFQRRAMAKLKWLVVKDNFETETAAFWRTAPEIGDGEGQTRMEDIQTEVFFFPSAQVAEMDGSFTNTQRLIKWHHKAADPPGDARSDIWFTYHLGKRLKALYADSTLPRDQGFLNLTWDYEPEPEEVEPWTIKDEPSVHKILKEINGFETATGQHLVNFSALKDDGSTACASWIYSGIFPAPDRLLAASRDPLPPDAEHRGAELNWGFSWPANRRVLYNRASARPDGQPWSERKKWIWWDPNKANPTGAPGGWVGYDVPDFPGAKAPTAEAQPDGVGLDAHSGTDPFIMKADGKGWLFAPTGLVDGPLPSHYEPVETPVRNRLYGQQNSPVYKRWDRPDNVLAPPESPDFPYVLSTYRLTEHHLSGVMSRWLPWLSELQPELFAEISPELAGELRIANTETVRIVTPRGEIRAKALVTRRQQPLRLANDQIVHHVGLPWHWGYQGVVTGAVVNDLSALIGDPNVSMHEGKSFVCRVEKV